MCTYTQPATHFTVYPTKSLCFFQAQSPLTYSFVSNKVRHRMIFLICCSLNSQFKEKFNGVEMLSFWTVSCSDGDQKDWNVPFDEVFWD